MTPSKPSECKAAVSLSEDGADFPYLSIFYTKEDTALHFFALTVHGVDENQDGDKFLVYNDYSETDADKIVPLLKGVVYDDGSASIEDAEFRNESEALNFIAGLRAVYQMIGELAKS